MKKYLAILKIEMQRYLTYRVNIASYAIGNVFEITAQIVVWTAIFQKVQNIGGYTYSEMMTYVIVGWFVSFATSNYGYEEKISRGIQLGKLTNFISKPVSFLKFMTVASFGRIGFAFIVIACIEFAFVLIMKNNLIFNGDFLFWAVFVSMIVVAYFIKLFFSFITGMLGFWITEISGTHASLNIISKFLSGSYFPIALLPVAFAEAISIFPFAYTLFFPMQLYLGKISIADGMKGLAVEVIWLFLLYGIIKVMWKSGIRKYEGVGI